MGAVSTWTGVAGASDNDVIYTSGDVSDYNTHYIQVVGSGTISVDVSLDGINFFQDVTFYDMQRTADATMVATAGTGKLVELRGVFKKFRVLQSGSTAGNAKGASVRR